MKEIFDKMVEMEREAEKNPNAQITYKSMWIKLKDEMQFVPQEKSD